MEDIFGPDRGLYSEPNFSFEDTFCREITSCLEYEEGCRASTSKRARERITDLGEMARGGGLFQDGERSPYDSSSPIGGRSMKVVPRAAILVATETASFGESTTESFTEGFQYDSSPCDDVGSCEQSSSGTWSADDDVNNGLGSPRVPMKRIRRLRANDRERRRMRSLNRALESLKKCIPVPQSKRRVTKLEILRIACSYIKSLSDTLRGEPSGSNGVFRKRNRADTVVNGFSVAQRLEILSGNGVPRI